MRAVSASLPVFPWDTLADAAALARTHPGGIVDLSVGTPVDPVAPLIREALAAAAGEPGYPATAGTPQLRAAAVAALHRRYGVTGLSENAVLPVIGSKELIAWLPTLLGLGVGDVVVIPELAYPTYEVGGRLAGATVIAADSLTQLGPRDPAVVFLNSPGNPTGRVLGADHLRKVVEWARERGALVVSDECYLGLGWDEQPVSVLHPQVCGEDHRGRFAGLEPEHARRPPERHRGIHADHGVQQERRLPRDRCDSRRHPRRADRRRSARSGDLNHAHARVEHRLAER